MNPFARVACLTLLLAAAGTAAQAAAEPPRPAAKAAPKRPAEPARQRVVLTEQSPGSPLHTDARAAIGRDLAEAATRGDDPLILAGTAALGAPRDRPALFVQAQSSQQCGSAGCSTSVHVFRNGRWQRVVDTVSGPIVVDTQRHGGMRDLIVNGSDRWIWNGSSYANTHGAPPPPASLQKKQVRAKPAA